MKITEKELRNIIKESILESAEGEKQRREMLLRVKYRFDNDLVPGDIFEKHPEKLPLYRKVVDGTASIEDMKELMNGYMKF